MKKLFSLLMTLSAFVCFGDVLWEKKIANPVNQTDYYHNNGTVDSKSVFPVTLLIVLSGGVFQGMISPAC